MRDKVLRASADESFVWVHNEVVISGSATDNSIYMDHSTHSYKMPARSQLIIEHDLNRLNTDGN